MSDAAPRSTLRDRQRELTRQTIFEAALEVFGNKGYHAVTVDDIVKRAGISRATFYLHFNSKATVLRGLRAQRLADWSFTDNLRWGPGKRRAIKDSVEKMVDFYTAVPVLHRSLHEARASDPEFAVEHRAQMERDVADWIASDRAKGMSPAQIRVTILMLYTMLDQFLYLWLVQGWEVDREAAVDAMTDALYATMK
ncbi:TetR/AcrR family transcriptional regulator [Cryptosporangium sp. NPDC048952]|uniref:TetR/AcrR family transcriptional regulator n=1 Tax=Cryptosporangium sp. NPDC048952 TaxID=3363961 RepID=UPI0037162598